MKKRFEQPRRKTRIYNLKIYLDTCCLSHPFNDQTQVRIRRETEAIETILGYFRTGLWPWIVSKALAFEVDNNRNWIQRVQYEWLQEVTQNENPKDDK